jgi:hypothetical protein
LGEGEFLGRKPGGTGLRHIGGSEHCFRREVKSRALVRPRLVKLARSQVMVEIETSCKAGSMPHTTGQASSSGLNKCSYQSCGSAGALVLSHNDADFTAQCGRCTS